MQVSSSVKKISDLNKAPGLKRSIAQAIDLLLIFLTIILLHAFWRIPIPLFKWVFLWIYLIYAILMDYFYDGTIGKLYLNLRVLRISDKRSKLLTAFSRNLMK